MTTFNPYIDANWIAYSPTLAVYVVSQKLAFRRGSDYSQLPPQIKTLLPVDGSRGIARVFSEYKANHAVAAAKGTVLASSREMVPETGKEILSSAIVYWLYAPKPLISPVRLLTYVSVDLQTFLGYY